MKKYVLLICLPNLLSGISNNPDFARRFGSNSHIYNVPLYFGKGRYRKNENKPHIFNYRKKVNRKITRESSR